MMTDVFASLAALAALQAAPEGEILDGQIVEETLPSVEELAFPQLSGDFDGDGEADRAIARQGNEGVQIALTLSSTGRTFVEALGADDLSQVEWMVVRAEDMAEFCPDPAGCRFTEPRRDGILVTLFRSESFVLLWDGSALETIFVD